MGVPVKWQSVYGLRVLNFTLSILFYLMGVLNLLFALVDLVRGRYWWLLMDVGAMLVASCLGVVYYYVYRYHTLAAQNGCPHATSDL